MTEKNEAVHCTTQDEWDFVTEKLNYKWANGTWKKYKSESVISLKGIQFGTPKDFEIDDYKIYTFDEWLTKRNLKRYEKGMKEIIIDVLEKTYTNKILRRTTQPLFMSNPGLGKSTIIREFAESKGVNMKKITLSQRMPNEVTGMVMPDLVAGKLIVMDSHELEDLKDGDILFLDEVFNGTLKQTLDAVLNLLEDRTLPTGKKLADIMIVAASNPQGLINITPQIKQRFDRYDLVFNADEYQELLKARYGMPEDISKHLCFLIKKETFESADWNYNTPRSLEKAINKMGCGVKSTYDEALLPFLSQKITCPADITSKGIKKGEEVEYLQLLKHIIERKNELVDVKPKIKNDTKNKIKESGASTNLPGRKRG